ncbi:uncharacterized protein LOC127706740 [Mytilus californianus]|uniref:uncharacterized protein LOC127706740 n=1 Tax=Mytilus californianus TaxID=6549 RepID=UPI002247022C|nr:uncharacterized protein LOC127706740 [Mytilus californianus]
MVRYCQTVEARGGAQRTATQIKEKWRKSCGAAREEAAKEKVHARTTGGGPQAKANDPVTQKILELHQGAPNFYGIHGGLDIGMPLPLELINNPFGLNENDASEFVVLNDPSNYVACNTEQREIIATVDLPTLRVKGVLGQESPSCQASVSSVVALIATKAKSSITKPVSVTQPKKKQTYQELQIEVLKLDKTRILQEKRKIISEREKLELEKTQRSIYNIG